MPDYVEQEIDLRRYVDAILSKWYWILGLGLLAGAMAYAASLLLLSPTYEATALVSVIESRQRVQFDPRIVTVEEDQPLKVYPEIATSDELLFALQNELPIAASFTLQQFRSMLKASPGTDPSLLHLTARNADPEVASGIVNAWAELFVSWANDTYGDSTEEQLLFFEQRLEDAAVELKASQEALVEYQAQNRSAILNNEIFELQQTHADLLAKDGEIEILLRDIVSLLAASSSDWTTGNLAAGDQLTALILKLRAFGGPESDGSVNTLWQLQVNSDRLAAEDGNDLGKQILNLRAALEIQAAQTKAAISEIEPRILSVQEERQEADVTESQMLRNVELAKDTHTALARTVEEKRITSQDSNAGVRLVSRSITPTAPIGPRKSLNALAAFAGVTFLSTLIIVFVHWWRTNEDLSQPPSATDSKDDDNLAVSG
jgi:capsular polysaccharide biosynthesis protein